MAEIDASLSDPPTEGMIALKFDRYHISQWQAHDTAEEAISAAYWMRESGEGWPRSIVSLDGEILIEEDELVGRMDQYEEAIPPSKPIEPPPPIPEKDMKAALLFSEFMDAGKGANLRDVWHEIPEAAKEAWRRKAAA